MIIYCANEAICAYLIEHSKYAQCESIELGVGFPEHLVEVLRVHA